MEITQVTGYTLIVLISGLAGIILLPDKLRSAMAIFIIIINSILTSIPAVIAIISIPQSGNIVLPHELGILTIHVDGLSAWFILIINFTTLNGVLYGSGYMQSYAHMTTNRQMHWSFFIMFHVSMLWVCMIEQGIAFIMAWELMSLSSLMLVIFEYEKKDTLRAGLNYMVQMHISVILLTLGFIWLFVQTGSFDFAALAGLQAGSKSIWIFIALFAGFAIKSGILPFHTWLPHAHPAAPSHVSGVMSGVIVKLGIYGILRVIGFLNFNQVEFGEIILGLSIITAIYGIANAAMNYDFKRMLAFCTIENIGIIGVGIGLGLIGLGKQNELLVLLGFSGALLHSLNHSLFKSLLFFSAGSVYQQTHTRNIELLGGLIKKMPLTAFFFLIGALAIGGLPPFNGFISEFLIYAGLFNGLESIQGTSLVILLVIAIAGLAIVGGLSVFTFTKTFGVIFLGKERKTLIHEPGETLFIMHLPQYMVVTAVLIVAVFPKYFCTYALQITSQLFPGHIAEIPLMITSITGTLTEVAWVSIIFFGVIGSVLIIRCLIIRNREVISIETWGCGYNAPFPKAQYTGRSFARPLGTLFSFFIKEKQNTKCLPIRKFYPEHSTFSTYYFDLIENYLITPLARRLTFTLNYFQFIQNGQIQSYVIYGIFFIILIFVVSAFHLFN
jgi:hydrogenase-4 component B